MGKTKNRMYSANDNRSSVTLKIQGPKSLVGQSEPFRVRVKVNTTWQALLNDQLKLKVPVDQGIYICNPSYKRTSKWRMPLNAKVRHYVNLYSRDMDTYTACIRHPDITNFMKCRQSENTAAKLKRLLSKTAIPPPPPPPLPMRPRRQATPPPFAVPSTSRGIPTPQSSVARWMPTIRSVRSVSQEGNGERGDQVARWDREEEMEVDGGFGRRSDEELSVVTTASQEETELIRLGIRREDIQDIKAHAARKLDGIGNSVLLRMRYEMQGLMREELWDKKIVPRAPLNAYYLSQLLSATNNN